MPGHENAQGTLLTPPALADDACDVDGGPWMGHEADELEGQEAQKNRGAGARDADDLNLLLTPRPSTREAALPYLIAALLFGFGVYQSVLYFGHKPIPNPDVTAFLRLGHELLSLQVPSSFKRAPVLGLLQVGLSRLVGGSHPELTAGWLLNGILHPFSVVLLWLIARRIIGRAGCWVALIVAMNPWTMQNLREPIAETALYFFILATFLCILTQSRWRYVLASAATMVRYDAAAGAGRARADLAVLSDCLEPVDAGPRDGQRPDGPGIQAAGGLVPGQRRTEGKTLDHLRGRPGAVSPRPSGGSHSHRRDESR